MLARAEPGTAAIRPRAALPIPNRNFTGWCVGNDPSKRYQTYGLSSTGGIGPALGS